jgi:hypothetical protein
VNSLIIGFANISSGNLLVIIAVLNTIITFIMLSWGKAKSKELEKMKSKTKEEKDLLIKAKNNLIFANNLTDVIVGTKTFVVSELVLRYNQEAPLSGISKDRAETINLYKKALSDFDENLNQI